MQVRATSIEQPNQCRVDVPDLIGTSGANADLRPGRINAFAGTPPLALAHEPVPGGGRGEDLAKPLRESSQRSCRYVAIGVGRDHLLDRLALGGGQLLRGRSWTGGEVVEAALLFLLPRMKSGVG